VSRDPVGRIIASDIGPSSPFLTVIDRIMNQGVDSCKVLLPDGRNIDICTPAGADIFLATKEGEFEFFSSNIGTASNIRTKKKLSAGDKSNLTQIYFTVDSIAKYGTPAVFRAHVPRSEIQVWVDHVMAELKKKTLDARWISTGTLEEHDAFILIPCICMFMHPVPVALAFEKGFFRVLADFVLARKGSGSGSNLPSADVCDTISLLVSNAIISCLYSLDNPWTSEKTFKKLEACGMLEQFMRCSTVPQEYDTNSGRYGPLGYAPGLYKTYDELLTCIAFLKKKFKKGEPCGDCLSAILNGTDGHKPKRPSVMKKLKTIASYGELLQPSGTKGDDLRICRHCNKMEPSQEFQMALKQCSRCGSAFYCSKKCQIADWKSHKKYCKPVTKEDAKMHGASQQSLLNFANKHYVDIMVKMVEACDETGVKKGDMLVALNFMPDANGVVPALESPPQFTIAPVRGFIEGSRPSEPDWFHKNTDKNVYEQNIGNVIGSIKDQHGRMTPSHVLCLVRNSGGISVYKIQLMEPNDGTMMFTDEAVDAFRSAINDDDFNPLSRIFVDGDIKRMKRQLGMSYGIGMPDEEMLDRTRQILNAMGGNFSLSKSR